MTVADVIADLRERARLADRFDREWLCMEGVGQMGHEGAARWCGRLVRAEQEEAAK